ncbi:hypothetical protein LCGC14_2901350 [marine sediment metagenome]|uniref:Uncharacterized protein n=1 Tax=marine sediment metagenome TaxID=412755 RepID=A0A0F9AKG1_9ZZZZ
MMKRIQRTKVFLIGAILVVAILVAFTAGAGGNSGTQGSSTDVVHVVGSNVWIVGGYGNNFVYGGKNYTQTNGFITIDVNNKTNEGIVVAEWNVKNWNYDGSKPSATGKMKVIWTDFSGQADFMDGGIANNLYLHGDSGKEAPVLPTVYTYSAGWGLADVYLNGKKIYDDVIAHYMVTDGTRDPLTHAVYKSDGKSMFVPKPMGGDSGDGFVYEDRIMTHLVVHTDVMDKGNNFPPFTMFMHINFEITSISNVSRL